MRNSEALSKSYTLIFLTFQIADTFLLLHTFLALGIFFRAVSRSVQHKIHDVVAPKVALKDWVRKLKGELD
jgi:hypothetical protein